MTGFRLAPIIISTVVVVGFITVLVLLVFHPVPISGEVGDLLKILTGTLSAKFGDVVQYHIGSSMGSKAKDDLSRALILQQPEPPKS